jgi:hypothetical protein
LSAATCVQSSAARRGGISSQYGTRVAPPPTSRSSASTWLRRSGSPTSGTPCRMLSPSPAADSSRNGTAAAGGGGGVAGAAGAGGASVSARLVSLMSMLRGARASRRAGSASGV